MMGNGDRVLGAVALLSAFSLALEARTFTVGFYTDPLGASGIPIIAAALIGIGGGWLCLRPQATAALPTAAPSLRVVATASSLLAYAAMLQTLGFLVSTTAIVSALALVFGGPVKRSVLLAVVYTVALYVVFFYVLGLRLPIGTLFLRGA